MRDTKALIDLAFDGFTVLCWAFVAYVVLRRFGFHQASPILAGVFALAALAALMGDWLRDRRHSQLVAGQCPACGSNDIATFHRCRAYVTASGRWQDPVSEWQCRHCGYGFSEGLACGACPERPGFWPR
jgi:predicted RNA-binding Zn-ribbon protein involved in translation (DUF1610 family)